jgi:probable selenium-dependent hydroxylase accessory protein YqeC
MYFPRARRVVAGSGPAMAGRIRKELSGELPLVVAGSGTGEDGKLLGVEKDLAGRFLEAGADLVVAEADGSAGRPFKAPREGEPVIPEDATAVIAVVGIDCLGRPLSPRYVHRPEVVAGLTGTGLGGTVTVSTVAGVFLHPRGYRKDVPPGARWIPFINKVETDEDRRLAVELAEMLGRGGAGRVIIGSARPGGRVREVLEF